jgi:hypothetical protein
MDRWSARFPTFFFSSFEGSGRSSHSWCHPKYEYLTVSRVKWTLLIAAVRCAFWLLQLNYPTWILFGSESRHCLRSAKYGGVVHPWKLLSIQLNSCGSLSYNFLSLKLQHPGFSWGDFLRAYCLVFVWDLREESLYLRSYPLQACSSMYAFLLWHWPGLAGHFDCGFWSHYLPGVLAVNT